MIPERKIFLQTFISREFFKAALLPLLVIEVTLLALYFLMNTYLFDKSVGTLRADRLSHLQGITESQARIVGTQLQGVSQLARVLQQETTRFFDHPEQFSLPDPPPSFGFAPNGVYHKQIDNGGCSLFYSGRTPIGDREADKALRSERLDPLYKAIADTDANVVAVYLNTFDSMSRYYPFFANVYAQLPARMHIPKYNFYYLADAAHNPGRGPVWTAAYLDPMGMGWMMSCIVPIYRGDFLEGVAGIDVTIKNFIDNLLGLQLPWGAHAFLVDAQGTIMAMPPEVEHIFGLSELSDFRYHTQVEHDTGKPETFNLLASILADVRQPVADLMKTQSGSIELSLDGQTYLVCQTTVAATGWKLMVIADRKTILDPILHQEQYARMIGYAAIGFMILFYILFFLYLVTNTRHLSGRIADPISGLSTAIQRLGVGVYETQMPPSPVVELDRLTDNFTSMANDLKRLHEDLQRQVAHANQAENSARRAEEQLKEHQAHLEQTVAERTEQLTLANARLQVDIAERRRVEKMLDVERRQLLSIFDSIDEPIYISAPDTYELLYANEAIKRAWPLWPEGKCYEVLQNRQSPCPFCTNSIIFGEKSGQAHIWEHENQSNSRFYRCIDKAIQWPDGRRVRYEMAIDITKQKRAAEEKQRLMAQLQRAEKMEALGTLAGGVAHDLNNILSGIVGYPDLLLMRMDPADPLRKPIQTIRESGLRAGAIVQDLLTLARRGVPVMEITNLSDIVLTYLTTPEYRHLMHHHPQVHLDTDLDQNLLNCLGSPVHLSKMVMNLVSNAAEAMPDGGTILIATANRYVDRPLKGYEAVQEGEYAVLRVADAGIGISPEDLERIFEPFYTKKKMGRSGTGLGMAVVWGTVKDHLGYIEVHSVPGRGTSFEIYLPATRQVPTADQAPLDIGTLQGHGETVLVVDDVRIQREIAREMLSTLGYQAICIENGEAAVAYLDKHPVDMVLLDMIMEPHIDGLETYRRITRIHPGQKAIIVSGFSETAAIKEAQRLGAGPYVKKPYTLQTLAKVLKAELAGGVT